MNMTEGPVLLPIILFSLPVLFSGVLQLLFNAADLAVVGRFRGDAAMGAVGCCGSLINLIVNLFTGLSVGTGVIAAQCIGGKRYEQLSKLINTAVTASLIGGVLVGALGFFLAEPLLKLMETPDDVLSEAVPYMRAYFCGMPGCLMYNYLASVLRSSGDTGRPLAFLTVAGVANVGLNFMMVLLFGMGALGVGISTAVSQYIAAGLTVIYMLRTDGICRITGMRMDARQLGKMILIGLPAGLQGTVFSISNVLIQSTVNGYGTAVVAGNSAAANLDGMQYIAMNSVYHAALTFTGQNVGAGTYRRIKRIAACCFGFVTFIGVIFGAVLVLFGDKLLLLYTSADVNPQTVQAGVNRLLVLGTTYFLCGWMEVGCGLMRGLGKTVTPMIVSLVGSCVFRILWIRFVCPLDAQNILLLYASYPVSWLITAAVHFACFAFCFKKLCSKTISENPSGFSPA